MKIRHFRVGVLVFLALFFVSPVLAQDDFVSTRQINNDSAAAVQQYWTPERMRHALPYPMPSGPANATSAITEDYDIDDLNQADGEPGLSPAVLPGLGGSLSSSDSDLAEEEELATPDDMALEEPEHAPGPHGYHMPFPFTMYEVNARDIRQFPYRTVGRIFFVTSTGSNSSCSGSSIGNRAVLTAGHCVSNGAGRWHRNWIFRPAYRDAGGVISSIGTWPTVQAWTFSLWHTSGSYCRDVGALIVANQGGLTLQQTVGALGHAWNFDAQHQHWNQFGYPAEQSRTNPNFLFNGTRMYENQASFARFTASWWNQTCTPLPYCFGSFMTGGASGGPEVLRLDPTSGIYPGTLGRNFANGVTSTYYLGGRVAGGICSPYFDTTVHNFITSMWAK